VMTTLLEDVLFGLPDSGVKTVKVDRALVQSRLSTIADDEDLRRYIL
jgi:ATP-dependent HslUV protease ATP-binding subunit HslU